MLRRFFPILLLALGIQAAAPRVDPGKALADFDPWMEAALRELHVPGAAVGVLHDGKVVFAKGYGVRSVKEGKPVTPATVFAVGSVTKSFTATVAATLVDEKRLEWDRPVREYLPWFRLYDPVATELITLRDLLTHRSGLPRHDFIRFSTYLDRREVIRRLRYLEPNHTFRDVYQYNNLMYAAAGFLCGEVAGSTWEDLVRDRIFRPLGMKSSSVAVVDMQRGQDFARPHDLEDGRPKEVEFYDYQKFGIGPNGAVNSSVEDMLKYLRFHLEGGTIVSPAQMRELHRPVTVAGPDQAYALGWGTGHYHGHRMVGHGGAITGFTAHVAMFPEDKLAIVVLNNLGSALPALAASAIQARIYGIDEPRREMARPARKPPEPARVANTKPSLPLEAYAGEYSHPAYGAIRIEQDGSGLKAVFSALTVTMPHWHYDTFRFGRDAREFAQFSLDAAGRAGSVALPLEPAVKPFVFTRVK